MPGHASLAVSARCEGSELAAFADLINNAAGVSIGGKPAGCDLHVVAAALLARVLATLPAQPQPQLLADILQLEGAVRGERCLPDVHNVQHQWHG